MKSIFIISILINEVYSLMNEAPYFLGTYLLRKTNDKTFQSSYTYLILNENNNIKIKTINNNFLVATKISRTGSIEFIKNYKTILNPLYYLTFNKKLNNIIFDNDIEVIVKLNNINKYSYSFLGIEFPEIKYKQISNYNISKKIRIKQKDYSLYIIDDKNSFYYLFDIYQNLNINKLPYIEIPFNTLMITQIIGFMVNIILTKFFDF